ncbi:winged helix-turn-helix transcriptional regulator [Candidatus Woesearchaeota archaeon]|nr:winged helix-turn-helix transcriptional regulator [Candidatus Woesearchaeota archaeon]
MDKKFIKLYAWVLRGSQRRKIFKFLDKPKTPTLIKEEAGIKVSNVSDILRLMEKNGLAKCLNPKDKLGRLYQLTNAGNKIRKELYSQ